MYSYKRIFNTLIKMPKDKIGKLYCDLNCFRWDENILGKAPSKQWKNTPGYKKYKNQSYNTVYKLVCRFLSDSDKSMYWWTIELGRTVEEWERWYLMHTYLSFAKITTTNIGN